ncbi:MAG: PKD domain-containing protein [Chitinophagaceae bacterium]|nr:MAG: PKD domain-containing protein [Chitinophagaceae bacterium]
MKKITLLSAFLILTSCFIFAQNNFHLSGTVSDSISGNPLENYNVYVYTDSAQPAMGFYYSDNTVTDSTGYYEFTIPGGASTGPNVNYYVVVFDCISKPIIEFLQNHQGTVNSGIADFEICGVSSPGNNFCVDTSQISQNVFCPSIYEPVCGCDGTTYHNECQARYMYGITQFTYGICGSSACSADFTYTLGLNDTVNFYYTGNSSIASYQWDFGDGNYSTDPNPSHHFSSLNTYTTCLTITDTSGCVDVFCQSVHVSQSPCPQAYFTYSNQNSNSLEFTFYGGGAPANTASWHWDFGDGDSSNLQVPSHTFGTAGIYYVCLTVYGGTSCQNASDTYCQYIYTGQNSCTDTTIIDMTAACNFIYSPVCGCDGITYTNDCVATYYNGVISYTTGPCGSGGSSNHFSIYGSVQHNNVNADYAKVYLYSFQTGFMFTIDTAYTTNGNYVFHNIAQGDYILKAELLPSSSVYYDFAPTYYMSTLYWNQADIVVLDSTANNVDIELIPTSLLSGPGKIGGNLSWQNGLKLSSESEEALENVPVFLLDSDGEMLIFTYTAAHGDFIFDDIPYGSYQVYVEWLGKESEAAYVTISSDNQTVDNIEFYVGETIFANTTGIQNQILQKNLYTVYPNPANHFADLLIHNSVNEHYEISIIDVFGKRVKESSVETCINDRCQIRLNVSSLSAGIYFIEIKNESGIQLEKLIITE